MAQTNYTSIILYNSGTTGNTPSTSNLASGELAINYTDGKLFYKDNSSTLQVIGWKTTPTTAGGTGLTSYTAGDLPYYASGTALSKLGIGTSGYVLESNGSAPIWVAQSTLSVGSATNATNTAITDNTSSSATWYPTIVSATTGNLPQTTSSTKLSFVPSTGVLAVNGTVIAGATSIPGNPAETIQVKGTTTGGQDYNIWTQGATSGVNAFAMRMYSTTAAAVVGSIQFSSTTTTYNITSDRRLKTNIASVTNSGEIIDALLPRTFNWIKDNSADIGFITDEYQTVFPSAVQGQSNEVDKDGNPVYQQGDFSTSAQIAIIVAELQSLRARLKSANIA